MSQTFTQVDAFTCRPFSGNPAAVCVLEQPRSDEWMQAVAREMNLSETAFLLPQNGGFQLRWFTPAVEVDLCGHATLAAAHMLWEEGYLNPRATAHFHTRSGLLSASRHDDWIELDFPAVLEQADPGPVDLADALGVQARYIGRNKLDYLVEVAGDDEVRAAQPDFSRLRSLGARGVMITAPASTPGYDFISRFFAPGSGIDEDPVTGSAHCCLGPFWGAKLGKNELRAYQASARGGELHLRLGEDRVYLRGQAVTVLRGEILG
jgi:PhzF family phenazine biosynthesis protein